MGVWLVTTDGLHRSGGCWNEMFLTVQKSVYMHTEGGGERVQCM